jgi:replicative DNA helicase
MFYDLRHQLIFDCLLKLRSENQAIDLILVQQKLKDSGTLEQIGGVSFLIQLQDSVPSAANLTYYLEQVQEKAIVRQVISVCTTLIGQAYEHQGSPALLLDMAEKAILAIRPTQHTPQGIKQLVGQAIGVIESLYGCKGAISGLSTGLPDLDHKTDGLHGGEMIVIAAYPGLGKSTKAANIAVFNALKGNASLFFSAEMRPVKIVIRAICAESRINLRDVQWGNITELGFSRMKDAATRIAAAPIWVENISGMTIGQIQAIARRMKQQHDIKLVAVDYIQLVHGPDSDTREQEVRAISSGLKAMAMELDVPVLALSQLNDDGRLRESRAIGQDADSIWKIEQVGEREPKLQHVKLEIEKCRDGEVGYVDLMFNKAITRFEEMAKVDDEDMPNKPYKEE